MPNTDPRIALRVAPVMSLTAVVASAGVEQGSGYTGAENVIKFNIAAWRINDGPVQSRSRRTIYLPDTDTKLADIRLKIPSCAVLHVDVRGNADKGILLLVRLHGVVSGDTELEAIAVRLRQNPKFYDDSKFGRFSVDSMFMEGMAIWLDQSIALYLEDTCYPANLDLLAEELHILQTLWLDQTGWDRRIREHAIKELLEESKDWRDEDAELLTAEQFSARMALSAIFVYPNGSFGFWFDCDDLFSGHSMQLMSTLANGPHAAHIEG